MQDSDCAYMLIMQTRLDTHDCADYPSMIMPTTQTCDDVTSYACRSHT